MVISAWLDDARNCVIVLDSDLRGRAEFVLSLNRAWRLRDALTEVLRNAGMDAATAGPVDDE
jgi:hypothetical protein